MADEDSKNVLLESFLRLLNTKKEVSSTVAANLLGRDHQEIIGIIKSLQAHEAQLNEQIITTSDFSEEKALLTEEGIESLANGSYEYRLFQMIPEGGIMKSKLEALPAYVLLSAEKADIGFKLCMKNKWISIEKNADKTITDICITRKVATVVDEVKTALESVSTDSLKDPAVLKNLRSRKLADVKVSKGFIIREGANFSFTLSKAETDLTKDMLADGSWKTRKFKPINLNALGNAVAGGHLHPLLKVRAEYRGIFLEMGFEEMPTNNYVESSFWNFDSLFQPQQHPARDMHDTFFLTAPATSDKFPEDYLERVRTMHEKGGHGSQGYGYNWSRDEASKNILRTHTTAVSARMLYKLAQQKEFTPVKYFSIDRVFRNEALDATHLAEFHQIEGVIADYNLTLGHLIGMLHIFFEKLGLKDLKFKPAYNPYTEPSMEIFAWHPALKKEVEIGNSGIFRPEMLLPMGLPKDVTVIAWGLSLERPTMIKYGYNNIRDLVGPKVDLGMAMSNPLCRLDK